MTKSETIAKVVAIRNRFNNDSNAARDLFYTSSANYEAYWDLLDSDENPMLKMLRDANLPPMQWECNALDYECDLFIDSDEQAESEIWKLNALVSRFCSTIDEWLEKVNN